MSLKTLREKLCEEQTDGNLPLNIQLNVKFLIEDIDQHRPLGPDGTHGNLHTETCGCVDKQSQDPPRSQPVETTPGDYPAWNDDGQWL